MPSLICNELIDDFDEVEYIIVNGKGYFRFRVRLLNGETMPNSPKMKLRDVQLEESARQRLYKEYSYLKENAEC
jgi:hypothetical protein